MSLHASFAGFWRPVRQFPSRAPLRIKLITVLLALVAVALVVISFAGISFLSSYLLDQADNQLQTVLADEAQHAVGQYLSGAAPGYSQIAAVDWIPAGKHLTEVIRPVGAGVGSSIGMGSASQGRAIAGPQVPADASWIAAHQRQIVTVPAASGGGRWRVLLESASYSTSAGATISGTIIVGVNVSTQYVTIGKLAAIDLIVSVAIILGLAIVGVAVVRVSLRPLNDIEHTAAAIAAGDLGRRVPDHDPRTEVGRLGRSLNTMLAQIETAFQARTSSESAARRSEERMRQFVADASHELRTPLTTIRGFADYYRQRGGIADRSCQDDSGSLDRAEVDHMIDRIRHESTRMSVLVEDLLLLARLDQERPLEQRQVDLLALAADAVQDARIIAPARTIELTVESGTAFLVRGDEFRLRQVIGNLMTNALTHTPEGTAIHVRLRSSSFATESALVPANKSTSHTPPEPVVVLEVADQGPGLSPLQASRIFDRFYRADEARGRKSGGTGLGLAIVAALVTAHDGSVSVDSKLGFGSTFRVVLPLAPEARPTDLRPSSAISPER